MKKLFLCLVLTAAAITTTIVSAKSYEYVLNYGKSQSVSFIKYNADSNIHTAIKAYQLNNASAISVNTNIQVNKLGLWKNHQTQNTVVKNLNSAYELNFNPTGGGNTKAIWTNKTSGTSLYGRFYLNNGLYAQ